MKDSGMSEKIFQVLLSPLGKEHVYEDRYSTTHQSCLNTWQTKSFIILGHHKQIGKIPQINQDFENSISRSKKFH